MWGPQVVVDTTNTPGAIDCPSTTLCVAAGRSDHIAVTADPVNGPWSVKQVGPGNGSLVAVDCPTTTACVVVDDQGNVMSGDPNADPSTWATGTYTGYHMNDVSCESPTFCIATVNQGAAYTFYGPLASPTVVDRAERLPGVQPRRVRAGLL